MKLWMMLPLLLVGCATIQTSSQIDAVNRNKDGRVVYDNYKPANVEIKINGTIVPSGGTSGVSMPQSSSQGKTFYDVLPETAKWVMLNAGSALLPLAAGVKSFKAPTAFPWEIILGLPVQEFVKMVTSTVTNAQDKSAEVEKGQQRTTVRFPDKDATYYAQITPQDKAEPSVVLMQMPNNANNKTRVCSKTVMVTGYNKSKTNEKEEKEEKQIDAPILDGNLEPINR